MTARQPYSDATALLGQKLDGKNARRDAVHLACEPVVNETRSDWHPNESMTFGSTGKLRPAREGETVIGIIDPFMSAMNRDDNWVTVEPGESCYLILLPGAVTSLRHVWSHPSFKDEVGEPTSESKEPTPASEDDQEVQKAEEWLRDYADEHGVDYDEMMSAARGHLINPDGWNHVVGGSEAEGAWTGDEFWGNVGLVIGIDVQPEQHGNIISCSC